MSDLTNFNPLQSWAQEIAAKREMIESDRLALEAAKQASMAKRAVLKLNDYPDIYAAFRAVFTPQEWMVTYGYSQRGNTFAHPNSKTGNYSCGVYTDETSVLRAHALSTNDPLYVVGNKSGHDAFSVFCTLQHGGDKDAALKDAGDNLLTIGLVSYNKAQQIEWTNQQKLAKTSKEEPKTPFSLAQFSLKGRSSEMEKKMLADKFVLGRIAIFGQATVIYAKPNTGKTLLVLWLLIQAIRNNSIEGADVFYINADDNYKGLVEKQNWLNVMVLKCSHPVITDLIPSVSLPTYKRW